MSTPSFAVSAAPPVVTRQETTQSATQSTRYAASPHYELDGF